MNLSMFKKWPVFQEYDVIYAGEKEIPTHIAPVKGTNIKRVNLLEKWLESRKKGDQTRPYMSIFEVELEKPWSIAAWCSRYGLPGNLLHKLIDVKLWPQWRLDYPPLILQPEYNIYRGVQKTPGDSLPVLKNNPELEREDITEGELLSVENAKLYYTSQKHGIEKPCFTYFDYGSNDVVKENIFSEYAIYFPYLINVEEHLSKKVTADKLTSLPKLPLPLEDNFWSNYAEPIEEIRQFIRNTREVIHTYEETGESKKSIKASSPEEHRIKLKRESRENYYRYGISRVSPQSMFPGGNERIIWEGPSLISAFLVQIMEDFEGADGQLRQCKDPKCEKYFITDNPRKLYCSSSCKNRHTTEKSRKKNKTKHKRGGTDKQY